MSATVAKRDLDCSRNVSYLRLAFWNFDIEMREVTCDLLLHFANNLHIKIGRNW